MISSLLTLITSILFYLKSKNAEKEVIKEFFIIYCKYYYFYYFFAIEFSQIYMYIYFQ